MRHLAPLLLTATLASCAGISPSVSFKPPSVVIDAEQYEQIYQRWRRHARINTAVWDQALDASVTLLSPEMRAASVAKVSEMRQLTNDERAKLIEEQSTESGRYLDFVLNAQTSKWEWNDFSSPRSLWSFVLIDDQGRQYTPSEVQPLPLKPDSVRALFPPVTPFTRTWRVRFDRVPLGAPPDPAAVGGPSTKWLALHISGPLGATAKPGESEAGSDPLRWDSDRR